MKKKRRVWRKLLFLVIVLAFIGAFIVPKLQDNFSNSVLAPVPSHRIVRGDIDVTITGSGILEYQNEATINLPEGIKIQKIFVKEGDAVSEGDVLAALDKDSVEYQVAILSADIEQLDFNLTSRKTISTVSSPVKGRVKHIAVDLNDDVIEAINKHGALAILSGDGLMKIALKSDEKLALNTELTVKWDDEEQSAKVVKNIEGGYIITLDDKKAPYLKQAEVYNGKQLLGSGILEINAPISIYANGGTIKTIHVDINSQVDARTKLFTLDNEPATDAYRKTLAERKEKAQELQNLLKYKQNPNVIASETGIVRGIFVEEDVKTQSINNDSEIKAFELATGGAIKMTIGVDELDVNSVQVGQNAKITLDAFSGEEFTAKVTRLSNIGKAAGCITTYDADLILEYDDRLKDAMNGSAAILVNSVENALIVPLKAVEEDENGSYVLILDGENQQTKVYITTGLSDGKNAEVLSGLKEGDKIVLPATILQQHKAIEFGMGPRDPAPTGGDIDDK